MVGQECSKSKEKVGETWEKRDFVDKQRAIKTPRTRDSRG